MGVLNKVPMYNDRPLQQNNSDNNDWQHFAGGIVCKKYR